MLLPLRFWAVALHLPNLFRGGSLHRAGLKAASVGDYDLADRLFEAAGLRYRAELRITALARLRIHQSMARAEWRSHEDHDAGLDSVGEIARRLMALDRIEDLDPPFREVTAPELLARWTSRFASRTTARAA